MPPMPRYCSKNTWNTENVYTSSPSCCDSCSANSRTACTRQKAYVWGSPLRSFGEVWSQLLSVDLVNTCSALANVQGKNAKARFNGALTVKQRCCTWPAITACQYCILHTVTWR